MTDAEWFENDLHYLLDLHRDNTSSRKLRLLAVACARRILTVIHDENCQTAVKAAERFADNQMALEQLIALNEGYQNAVAAASRDPSLCDDKGHFACKAKTIPFDYLMVSEAVTKEQFDYVYARDAMDAIMGVVMHAAIPEHQWTTAKGDEAALSATGAERPEQIRLFHDIFEGVFQGVVLDPAWLKWDSGRMVKLAQAMYDEGSFKRTPLLADMLAEAGCADGKILAHCRQPGEHVRGCWVVDLILGKR